METFILPIHPVLIFLVVLARVGGLVTFAPFWAHNSVTIKIRVIVAGVLAFILTPLLMTKLETPPSEISALALVLFGELLIGLALGFVGRLVFAGFEMAAHMIGAQMGFSLAGVIDPATRVQTTTFGIAAQLLGLIILLTMNGHHWFLTAAVRSFATTPPGSFTMSAELLDIFLRLSANAITVGITLAAPAIIVLLVVEFGLEFFGRTAPQFQVFILGFPLKIGIGLWIIGASLYFMPNAFRDILTAIHTGLFEVLKVL